MLVKWLQTGNLFRKGEAIRRARGDQDIMPEHEARSYVACGLVEIVDDAAKVEQVVAAEPATILAAVPETITGMEYEIFTADESEDLEDYECLS